MELQMYMYMFSKFKTTDKMLRYVKLILDQYFSTGDVRVNLPTYKDK